MGVIQRVLVLSGGESDEEGPPAECSFLASPQTVLYSALLCPALLHSSLLYLATLLSDIPLLTFHLGIVGFGVA